MVWEIRDVFDVWGNEKDGWEVNDTASVGEFEIPENIIEDDKKLLEFFVEHGWLVSSDRRQLEVNGDFGAIEILERKTGRPLYWLLSTEYRGEEYMHLHSLNSRKEN